MDFLSSKIEFNCKNCNGETIKRNWDSGRMFYDDMSSTDEEKIFTIPMFDDTISDVTIGDKAINEVFPNWLKDGFINEKELSVYDLYFFATNEVVKSFNQVAIFNSHGADSELNARSGSEVTILRELERERYDAYECGNMYRIRFADGLLTDVFSNELEAKQSL